MLQFHFFNYEDLTVLNLENNENDKTADGFFIIRRNYFDKSHFPSEQNYNLHILTSGAPTVIFRLARKLMDGRTTYAPDFVSGR